MINVVSASERNTKSTSVFDTHTLVERRNRTAEQIRAGEQPYAVRIRLQELSNAIDWVLSERATSCQDLTLL